MYIDKSWVLKPNPRPKDNIVIVNVKMNEITPKGFHGIQIKFQVVFQLFGRDVFH